MEYNGISKIKTPKQASSKEVVLTYFGPYYDSNNNEQYVNGTLNNVCYADYEDENQNDIGGLYFVNGQGGDRSNTKYEVIYNITI